MTQVGHVRHQKTDLQQTRNTCADGRDWRLTGRRQRQQPHTGSGVSRRMGEADSSTPNL